MKFICPHCGKVKKISFLKVLFELLLHHSIQIWCNECFTNTQWHLKLWRKNYILNEVKQNCSNEKL